MFVCLCNAVTDTQIRSAVADGAVRMRDLSEQLGVASDCGKCARCVNTIRCETLREMESLQRIPAAA